MTGERGDLRDEVRRLLADGAPAPGEHPEPGELIDYHERRLSAARADEVQEHLAVCPDCAALALEYARDWADDAEVPAAGVAPEAGGEAASEPAWHRRAEVWRALAAALAAVALGLGLWIAAGERGDAPGVRSVWLSPDVEPASAGTRGGGTVLTVPAWAQDVALVLPAPGLDPAIEYGIEIRADGRRIERTRGLRVESEGTALVVAVDAGRLSPGGYELTLLRHGAGAGDGEPVETYSFTVERAEAGAGS